MCVKRVTNKSAGEIQLALLEMSSLLFIANTADFLFYLVTQYLWSSLPSLCATTLQTASGRSLTCASDILFFNVAIPVSHHAWEEFHALILFISIDKLESIK